MGVLLGKGLWEPDDAYQSEWLSSRNPQIINAEEGMERRELSYTVGGKINLYSHSNCMEVA